MRKALTETVLGSVFLVMAALIFAFAMFFRQQSEGETVVRGAVAAILLSALMLLFAVARSSFSKDLKISRSALFAVIFFCYAACAPALSSILLGAPAGPSFRFVLEVAACAVLFFSFYIVFARGYISIHMAAAVILGLSILTGFLALTGYMQAVSRFHRLDAFSAVNLYGNVMAIAALCGVFLAANGPRSVRWFAPAFLALACLSAALAFATGSRQAVGSLILGLVLFKAWSLGAARAVTIALVMLPVLLFGAVYLWQALNLDLLVERYSTEFIVYSLSLRFQIFQEAIAGIPAEALLFGRADLYEVWNPASLHPHNQLISTVRHLGVPALGLFVYALILSAIKVFKVAAFTSRRHDVIAASVMFLLAMFYVMVSGNMTRSLHFYIFWGIMLGVADHCRQFPKAVSLTSEGHGRAGAGVYRVA